MFRKDKRIRFIGENKKKMVLKKIGCGKYRYYAGKKGEIGEMLVKSHNITYNNTIYESGIIRMNDIIFPKNLIGKRFRIVLEDVEEVK